MKKNKSLNHKLSIKDFWRGRWYIKSDEMDEPDERIEFESVDLATWLLDADDRISAGKQVVRQKLGSESVIWELEFEKDDQLPELVN